MQFFKQIKNFLESATLATKAFSEYLMKRRKELLLFSVVSLFCLMGAECILHTSFAEKKLFPKNVGWKTEDWNKLHEFNPDQQQWFLREVNNMKHIHDRGEYDYSITTTGCFGYFVRSKCYSDQPAGFHFGDSFAFGFGVEEDDTFIAGVDQNMAGQINFGVPGDNIISMIDRSLALLQTLPEEKYPKNLFFHIFTGNDIEEAVIYLAKFSKGNKIEAIKHEKDANTPPACY